MRPPRLALLTAAFALALLAAPTLPAQEKLPAPMPVGVGGSTSCDGCAVPCCPPCPPACPAPPKVVVEMSQPEIRFAAPCHSGGGCQKGCCAPRSKGSWVNINISRVKSHIQGAGVGAGGAGALQPVTSVIPAYATATIPIAFQTTQFAAFGAQAGLLGAGVGGVGASGRQASELTRGDIQDMVREAIQREAAQREAAQRQASQLDSCAELKGRVDKIEKRLTDLETQVKGIVKKLTVLP